MKKLILLALLGLFSSNAWAGDFGTEGDDDPYPLACINFSGEWKSHNNEYLSINQEGCKWLKIRYRFESKDNATTIVPDDKVRAISGAQFTGQERHRWNDKNRATTIETYRDLRYSDKTVHQLVVLDQVNPDMILETTYTTTKKLTDDKDDSDKPVNDIAQRQFRRIKP